MNKEEKQRVLFDMLNHPEDYTEEQLSQLLDDEEIRQDYETLAMTKHIMTRDKIGEEPIDVDAQWQRFSKRQRHYKGLKAAAVTTGVILMSGIAMAAVIRLNMKRPPASTPKTPTTLVDTCGGNDLAAHDTTTMKDVSPDLTPTTFEDAPLGDILRAMAAFYKAQVNIDNKAMLGTRLYFVWDKRKSLEENINLLNGFERINLTVNNNIITEE